jgi:cell division protein FtsB
MATRTTNRLNSPVNYDSVGFVTREGHTIVSPKERLTQGIALALLLVLGGLAAVGPSGLLAWGDNLRLLDQRHAQIAKLTHERDELKLQVDLLNPNHADPDLSSELIRKDLNMMHPDEVVILLDKPAY